MNPALPQGQEGYGRLPSCLAAMVSMGAGISHAALTCHASRQPHSTGAGACVGLGRNPVTQEHIRDEVEAVARDVPQQHGTGAPVQPCQAFSPHDGYDAMHRPLVGWLFPKSCHPGLQSEVGCKDRAKR